MSPEYEKVIDPLFTNLLAIIQRADRLSIRDLTVELREEFDRANSIMETDREWKYALYAMVAWVDSEMIISHNRWKDETLEAYYFKSGNAYTEFFLRAEKAYEKRYFNAFEVFYICFMFGYHGVYQTGDKTTVPKSLPVSDAEWQKKAAGRIARIRKTEKEESWGDLRDEEWESRPLDGSVNLINSLIFFAIVAMVTAMLVLVRLFG
ncbi:MAG: DotU family type IV/VI secretion system protein [Planctomycetota bacterium]